MYQEFGAGILRGFKVSRYIVLVVLIYLAISWFYPKQVIIQTMDPVLAILLFFCGLPLTIVLRIDDIGVLLATWNLGSNQWALLVALLIVVLNLGLLGGLIAVVRRLKQSCGCSAEKPRHDAQSQ